MIASFKQFPFPESIPRKIGLIAFRGGLQRDFWETSSLIPRGTPHAAAATLAILPSSPGAPDPDATDAAAATAAEAATATTSQRKSARIASGGGGAGRFLGQASDAGCDTQQMDLD